jgi:hypothetical protein
MPDHADPSRPDRRRGLWVLAVTIFFVILFASAAGIVLTKHLTGGVAVSPVNAETAPILPLSAGLSTAPPVVSSQAAAAPANAKVTAPPTSATPAAKPGTVGIDSFAHPNKVDCTDPQHQATTIPLSWKASNATRVTLSIDGPGVYKTYGPTAGDSVPFSCPGPHTYLLTAYGADGRSVDQTATITAG